jgi:2-succinyl-5-enolpyruvyl-6-hydroxy-3-cyclohexene-1-carboxylate synthase
LLSLRKTAKKLKGLQVCNFVFQKIDTIYPKIPLAQSIIEICLAKGITNIIISPGSRNSLTIGFVSNPAFNVTVLLMNERRLFF